MVRSVSIASVVDSLAMSRTASRMRGLPPGFPDWPLAQVVFVIGMAGPQIRSGAGSELLYHGRQKHRTSPACVTPFNTTTSKWRRGYTQQPEVLKSSPKVFIHVDYSKTEGPLGRIDREVPPIGGFGGFGGCVSAGP